MNPFTVVFPEPVPVSEHFMPGGKVAHGARVHDITDGQYICRLLGPKVNTDPEDVSVLGTAIDPRLIGVPAQGEANEENAAADIIIEITKEA
jgi:hypothetical protein